MALKPERKRLGEILISAGVITGDQLQNALELQKSLKLRLGEVLIHQGLVTEEDILRTMKSQLGLTSIDLNRVVIREKILTTLPESVIRKYNVLPVDHVNGALMVAMSDPTDYYALDDLRIAAGTLVRPVLAKKDDISRAIDRYYGKSEAAKAARDFIRQAGMGEVAATSQGTPGSSTNIFHRMDGEDEATPVIRFINTIIENAVNNMASDIHIEPMEEEMRVRFRIDGVLREIMRIPTNMANPVVSRIKIMADLNIAEKRLPQDGRITYPINSKMIDLRVSIMPTMFGEKVVMRILDKATVLLDKESLGLGENEVALFDALISKSYGILLVTGPTGSGKTTTLYSMLNQLNTPEKNIITLEDPVEYNFQGINQTQVNPKAGLTFASGLRSILRQDPDIIMVGEMRDNETAEIAIRSALTGHLVLSTIHTNDAASAITRLVDMDMEPFLISASLIGVISQRLIRKICPDCIIEYEASSKEKYLLKVPEEENLILKKGKGCTTCHDSGYKGRTAIFEFMPIYAGHRQLIDQGASSDELRNYSIAQGMNTLQKAAAKKVLGGISTVEELLRVTFINE